MVHPSKTERFTSFVYEVVLTKIDGSDTDYYGIKFRLSGVDGYNLMINGDGYYQLTRYVEALQQSGQSGYDRMIERTKADEGVINLGNSRNRLKVAARGTQVTIYVNDRWLGSVIEAKPEARKSGTIGVVCGSGIHLAVNNVRLWAVASSS